jgi:glutathione S-transferase
MITLYDLAAADDDVRFSSPCWRVKMALKHKGLEFETVPWRYHERAKIEFSGSAMVPIIVDKQNVVAETWNIAGYLEDTYPERPSLFSGGGRTFALFTKRWVEVSVAPLMARTILPEVFERLHPDDKAYFRKTLEKLFGISIEDMRAARDTTLVQFRNSIEPLRSALAISPYLCGEHPGFADYALFGHFMFARSMSSLKILEESDPVFTWRNSLLSAFDGYAGRIPHIGP